MAGGPYNIPRNTKGEGRILMIFSTKAFLITGGSALAALVLIYIPLSMFNQKLIGIIAIVISALIGFIVGTFKVPNTSNFEITRKTGGENIDEVIKRYFKYKTKKNKIYTYFKGGNANGQQKLD